MVSRLDDSECTRPVPLSVGGRDEERGRRFFQSTWPIKWTIPPVYYLFHPFLQAGSGEGGRGIEWLGFRQMCTSTAFPSLPLPLMFGKSRRQESGGEKSAILLYSNRLRSHSKSGRSVAAPVCTVEGVPLPPSVQQDRRLFFLTPGEGIQKPLLSSIGWMF